MGKARDLLHAAAGELQLRSAKGNFFQVVAEAADAVLQAIQPRLFIQTYRMGVEQEILVPDIPLIPNQVAQNGGIPFDPTLGTYFLRGGHLHALEFFGAFDNYTTPASNFIEYGWFANGQEISPICRAFAYPQSSTENASTQPVAKTLYRPSSDVTVLCGVIAIGDPLFMRQGSYAIVRELD